MNNPCMNCHNHSSFCYQECALYMIYIRNCANEKEVEELQSKTGVQKTQTSTTSAGRKEL